MIISRMQPSPRGFALVITLALLALLILGVFALSALVKVGSDVAHAGSYQVRARQHALLALDLALGELQRTAGDDSRITGMAGIAGVSSGATNTTRHWCGAWDANGNFLRWLVSGANASPMIDPSLTRITLVGAGSVGASSTNSEQVEAGKIEVQTIDSTSHQSRVVGGIAYWIGDEGVKVSAYSAPGELAAPGVIPVLSDVPVNSAALKSTLSANSAKIPSVLSFEQLRVMPATALAASVLKDNFHHATLSSIRLVPQSLGVARKSGTFNINTTSAITWRGLFQTYNQSGATPQISSSALGTSVTTLTTLQGRITSNFAAATTAGKSTHGPFTSVDSFATSGLLSDALLASGSGVTPTQFMVVMRDVLTVRSDTFRIRAYGDSVNLDGRIESRYVCEAVVQRTVDFAPNGLGRKFVITCFRWLSYDDI
ncbi:hypothetical protein [Oleiharenicola lentus]|uniref:hypothetical protein n=1 Tax=Oleiharenicola lentus TaxID=2508720 RepID=UPI003F67DCF2